MGRITLFVSSECSHCMRAKGALLARHLPYQEIDLLVHPGRRNDMVKLSDQLSVPQVFFNDDYVGGADNLIALLEEWDEEEDGMSVLDRYEEEVGDKPDPSNMRLTIPLQEMNDDGASSVASSRSYTGRAEEAIMMPSGINMTINEMTLELQSMLDIRDRPYRRSIYRKAIVAADAVTDMMNHFDLASRDETVQFIIQLQQEYQIFQPVNPGTLFADEKDCFFRLQCDHDPSVLNSFCVWKGQTDSENANAKILRMKRMLHKILSKYTSLDGLIDYKKCRDDVGFCRFEEATCELQAVDLEQMNERTRKAFCLNLYNLFISYAFVKVGISTSALNRGAFFNSVQMNVGGDLLSFNDLEHGILRANKKHPYASKPNFLLGDSRQRLTLTQFDPRIHFALNCGAKSCPPVKYFRPESLDEDLRVVTMAFCEKEECVLIDEKKHSIKFSMLLKWFGTDFCPTKTQLPVVLLPFLRGDRQQTVQRMLIKAKRKSKPIHVSFQKYDWSANASQYHKFNKNNLARNVFNPLFFMEKAKLATCSLCSS